MKIQRSFDRARLALAAAALAIGACGGDTAVESQHEAKAAGDAKLPLLELSVAAPWTTTYSGVRRVQSLLEDGDPSSLVAYRERVSADGEGRFAVELVDVLSFVPNPATFALLQSARQGYLYRYRDFAVRDLAALLDHWVVTDPDVVSVVAGRACQELHVAPGDGAGSSFDVALDQETGLVLRAVERNAQGVEVGRMEFESYDAAPELDAVAWFTGQFAETPLDPFASLDQQAGFDVLQPAVLPDGFQPWRAALVQDPEGGIWLKQVFTDGVRPLFFFHRNDATPPPSGGGTLHVAGEIVTGAQQLPRVSKSDRIYSYRMGGTDVVQGVLRGRETVALGEVGDTALLDLLESAID